MVLKPMDINIIYRKGKSFILFCFSQYHNGSNTIFQDSNLWLQNLRIYSNVRTIHIKWIFIKNIQGNQLFVAMTINYYADYHYNMLFWHAGGPGADADETRKKCVFIFLVSIHMFRVARRCILCILITH